MGLAFLFIFVTAFLDWEVSPFIFKVIIDRHVFIAIAYLFC